MIEYKSILEYAKALDTADPLAEFRNQFHLPTNSAGASLIYLCGNSLGLEPKLTRTYIEQELKDWEDLGVEGHLHARNPWLPYHEFLTRPMAEVVGAKDTEVVVMNSLSVNLHLLMVSFYRPTAKRNKILIEYSAFPSDRYAALSQIRFHGYEPSECLIELKPEEGTEYVSWTNLKNVIEEQGEEIALVLIGGVNYYTGQLYPMKSITDLAHEKGCTVGFDLAHAAGNVPLELHNDGPDFAAWCSYKYLNAGPGSLSGMFIHERHHGKEDIPRFEGWWGHDKQNRFKMGPDFHPIPTAEAWQLSNPPILSMAAIRASLEVFMEAEMDRLFEKSRLLTGYLEFLLNNVDSERIRIITPANQQERGCQLSIQVKNADKSLYDRITEAGVIADWREPDVIRVAPVPLYNTFEEMWQFVHILNENL